MQHLPTMTQNRGRFIIRRLGLRSAFLICAEHAAVSALFDRYRFGKVARLVHVRTFEHRDVVGEQLKRRAMDFPGDIRSGQLTFLRHWP